MRESRAIPFGTGVLFFPVTPFDRDGALDLGSFVAHLERGLAWQPGGLFAACGTGEFYSLSVEEHAAIARAAVRTAAAHCPVLLGAGGPLSVARAHVRSAADAGAAGVLLMPPYLSEAPGDGRIRYVESIAELAADAGVAVIVYHRSGLRLTPEAAADIAELPAVAGIKDGVGDIDLIARMRLAVQERLRHSGKPFQFFNGLPTAEITAAAYRGLGIDVYSSAVFSFAPEIAVRVREAVRVDDAAERDRWLRDFYAPFSELRASTPGYAVSLIKAGMGLRGWDVGGVRPPLIDPQARHVDALRRLLADVLPSAEPALTREASR